jgi:hypothetical protein
MLGSSYFFVKILISIFGANSKIRLRYIYLLFKFPILKTTSIFKILLIMLGNFQGQQVSQNFALLVFKGGFHKSIIKNQCFFVLLCFFKKNLGVSCVSFFIIIIK